MIRCHRPRVAAWVAVLAILAGALLPAIGQLLLRAVDADRFEEICTANGLLRVAVPAGGDERPADSVADGGHCPFCLPHGGHPSLPPPAGGVRPAIAVAAATPGPAPRLPQLRPVWPAALSRGPPSAS